MPVTHRVGGCARCDWQHRVRCSTVIQPALKADHGLGAAQDLFASTAPPGWMACVELRAVG
jgi:hypothetical protein